MTLNFRRAPLNTTRGFLPPQLVAENSRDDTRVSDRATNSLACLSLLGLMLCELLPQGSPGHFQRSILGIRIRLKSALSFLRKMCLWVLDQTRALKAVRARLIHKVNPWWETAAWFSLPPHSRATATP